MPTNLSPTCQNIDDVIKGLQQHKQALAAQLQQAGPGLKPIIVEQIEELNQKIQAKKKELEKCIKEHPYVPPEKPKPMPKECAALKKEIEKLKGALSKEVHAAVAHLQEQLQHAAGDLKIEIIQQIKEITADIKKNSPTAKKLADKINDYNRCILKYGGLPALDATFKGRATLTTSNDDAPGPFKQSVNIGLHFVDWDHSTFMVTSFPPISVTYDTDSPAGTVTTTVTMNAPSGGEFNPITNWLSILLRLFFHHSTDLAGDSTLEITLLTTSLLTSDGKITVEGSAPFKDGFLDEDLCWLTVEGTISPRP
jgi:gas vesicle protein